MMNSQDEKHYYEEYARLSIVDICPSIGKNLVCLDKPDLQNEIDDIGIEVTSSMPSKEKEAFVFGKNRLGKYVSEKDERNFRGSFYLDQDRKAYAFSAKKGLSFPAFVAEIQSIITEKRNKVFGYKNFNKTGLYVFTGYIIEECEEATLTAIDYNGFDMLILNFINRIIWMENGALAEYNITNDQLKDYKNKAKSYVEAEH